MKKEELKDILTLDARINTKLRQLDQWRSIQTSLGSVDYTKDRVQGGSKSGMEDLLIKIFDLSAEIGKDVDELINMKEAAKELIDQLDGKYNLIMNLRYLECLPWEQVARKSNYTLNHVFKIHGKALQEMAKVDSK